MRARALKALFATLKDNIELVVLNACYSRTQGAAISEEIDFVIGMDKAIGDEAATTFAASLYSALGFNRTVGEAFEQARTALLLEGIPEENTPQLLVRRGASANWRLGSAEDKSATRMLVDTLDRGSLRSALTLGWQLARYEFADGSPIPEAAASANDIRDEIDDLLRRDGVADIPAQARAPDLIDEVLHSYSSTSPERHAAILIGIAGLRAGLLGASANEEHNRQLAQIAFSAIMEIDPSLMPIGNKEAYFEALLRAHPRNIVELLEFVDRSAGKAPYIAR